MNKFMLTALAPLLLTAMPVFAAQEFYNIDSSHTYPSFELNHMGFSIQRGTFDQTQGKLEVDFAAKKGAVDIIVNTASIDTGHDERDKHMRGDKFFNVEKFPTMTFSSHQFIFEGDKLVKVVGQLTLLGVTKPLVMTVNQFHCGKNPMTMQPHCGADLSAALKRSEYGMTAYVPIVGDNVTLHIQVEANKKVVTTGRP